jgi:hypothetical protein
MPAGDGHPGRQELATFEETMGMSPSSASASDAKTPSAGLIKAGVRCAAYVVEPEKARLVDLEAGAARRRGDSPARSSAPWRKRTPALCRCCWCKSIRGTTTAETRTEKSVQRVKARLLGWGFTEDQIAVHTAKEPDADCWPWPTTWTRSFDLQDGGGAGFRRAACLHAGLDARHARSGFRRPVGGAHPARAPPPAGRGP